ncbi:MAG: hypothetical protein A2X98_04445 [Deltaproteobacteria bacterium GWC2_66_88]|nr:MAG: hypothetical protein A2X98_04445 [Deltaproteobacteria bacterium GWC2_66_88]
MFRIDAVIAFAQLRQIGLTLNGKSTSLITAVLSLQHEAVALPTIMNQFAADKWCAAFLVQQVS